ncbi:polysaccharide pyruvyl transferase family protein [Vibrio sp. dsl-7]|uniref:Polysaccharide pyruvyl transferase family protein n=1 Tax=Vibrio chanodichtyis TaxID=3027932 RepID=A0ABT5V5F2_9VIBR|nr:polysaccharide pyruvyl transferase family protein [Vibrio chanodichtyis]MDE1515565.1 polysaccharide pyruvyl transferase family protein [Vibrio chanodichtyis]
MYLEYCTTKLGNFGDDLNPWIFPKLIPNAFKNGNDKIAFLGIGTILDQRRVERENLHLNQANIVFSSGAGFGKPPTLDKKWHIYCVRGSHTAKQLKIDNTKVIADGAYLLRNIVNFKNIKKKYKVSFIPHHGSEDYTDWAKICEQCGINFISMRQSVDNILQEMLETETIITEAMHGAIVADALRVPWIPVSYSPKFMLEKWQDFAGALSIDLSVDTLPFHVHKKLNLGQNVENSLKRTFRKLGVGPIKWDRLPSAYKKSSTAQMDQLCEQLLNLSINGKQHQSTDIVVEGVTQRLTETLDILYTDYISGKFFK